MSFFEDFAAALDTEGIESRVNNDILFVPISSDLEVQFVEIDPLLPAANVYIATAEDDDYDAVLTSVVFSVEDAVKTVASYVATDQIVTVMRDLIEGTDERIEDLTFEQDEVDEDSVWAPVTDAGLIKVDFEVIDGVPTAHVAFITMGAGFDELVDTAIIDIANRAQEAGFGEEEIQLMVDDTLEYLVLGHKEVLELGDFTDFDRLFDVLSLAADQAESWEEQMSSLVEDEEEVDFYDLFGADDEDDDEFYFDEDEEFDDEKN
ncbi:hypothetical protein P4N68_11590 [Corynebacterium felinum]|uniref:DNA primase n=1 Tax=Corynebacterium felinum TaxID=131318 RepID=A0ABU2B9J0_9CORY|nr:hypothetical protein [Corynebacterium felinum]MDF5821712.1 hypothetical protein [Corynebacterium felinum]MDR7355268.1 hypothetical protein [Corynebacterium felinum]WJY94621.1 hypothetical protein CFELI_04960 [Corynebacterium felinum]